MLAPLGRVSSRFARAFFPLRSGKFLLASLGLSSRSARAPRARLIAPLFDSTLVGLTCSNNVALKSSTSLSTLALPSSALPLLFSSSTKPSTKRCISSFTTFRSTNNPVFIDSSHCAFAVSNCLICSSFSRWADVV